MKPPRPPFLTCDGHRCQNFVRQNPQSRKRTYYCSHHLTLFRKERKAEQNRKIRAQLHSIRQQFNREDPTHGHS